MSTHSKVKFLEKSLCWAQLCHTSTAWLEVSVKPCVLVWLGAGRPKRPQWRSGYREAKSLETQLAL